MEAYNILNIHILLHIDLIKIIKISSQGQGLNINHQTRQQQLSTLVTQLKFNQFDHTYFEANGVIYKSLEMVVLLVFVYFCH